MAMHEQLTFILPEEFERGKLKAIYEELYPVYDEILNSVCREVRNILETHGRFPTIKYRIKRFDAYFDKLLKMSRRDQVGPVAAITDILGLRIICPFLEDLEVIENLIKSHFHVVELDHKSSRHTAGEFGYDSIHFLIRIDPVYRRQELPYTSDVCEVQLRTILQDAWAEVEHELIYKTDITLPIESVRRKLAALNATLTLSDLIFQELRDYQKDIREQDRKRRQSLEAKLAAAPNIDRDMGMPPEKDQPAIDSAIDWIVGEANLEKALLAALEAHSGGQLENAVEIYTSILRLKVKDSLRSLVYNHRGMAYFALSDYLRAIRDFSKSIKYDSGNVRGYNNRALAFRVLKRYDRSLEDYDRSVALNPCQMDAFWGRAQTHYEMKLYSQALSDCEKALSLQADFTPAQSLVKRLNKLIF
ncbi:MAG TPA: tetratricopeptide repeat protein [Smithellaceae bacterium]|nr:tetratricopeptide repeat protein [Smithellaceae bacterium]